MDLKNTMQLSYWLRSGASLEDVERTSPVGMVGNQRYDVDQAQRAYRLLWTWGSHRYTGEAARQQERFMERCGPAALGRRMARAREWAKRLS